MDWKLREALLGFEPIEGSHTGWNLARIVKKVLIRHNLTDRLFAVTADNASNNGTLRSSLEVALASLNVAWNAKAMTVNCLAHVINLSAKVLLDGLRIRHSVLDTSSMESTEGMTAPTVASASDNTTEDDGTEIAGTVGKVSLLYITLLLDPY
jgi:hypothetical protein